MLAAAVAVVIVERKMVQPMMRPCQNLVDHAVYRAEVRLQRPAAELDQTDTAAAEPLEEKLLIN